MFSKKALVLYMPLTLAWILKISENGLNIQFADRHWLG